MNNIQHNIGYVIVQNHNKKVTMNSICLLAHLLTHVFLFYFIRYLITYEFAINNDAGVSHLFLPSDLLSVSARSYVPNNVANDGCTLHMLPTVNTQT